MPGWNGLIYCLPTTFGLSARGSARRPLDQRPADLPVMPEGVGDSSEQPAVLLGDRVDLRRARGLGLLHDAARVVDDDQHPLGRPAERLRAEVVVIGRLVLDPERPVPTASCATISSLVSSPPKR